MAVEGSCRLLQQVGGTRLQQQTATIGDRALDLAHRKPFLCLPDEAGSDTTAPPRMCRPQVRQRLVLAVSSPLELTATQNQRLPCGGQPASRFSQADLLAVCDHREVLLLAARTRSAGDAHSGRGANDRSGAAPLWSAAGGRAPISGGRQSRSSQRWQSCARAGLSGLGMRPPADSPARGRRQHSSKKVRPAWCGQAKAEESVSGSQS
jgi:hypothetical protein